MSSLITVGAGVVCYINGIICGKIISFNYSAESPRRFIQTVDTLVPYEAVAGPTQVSGQIKMYRVRGDGGAEGLGLVGPQVMADGSSGILNERYFTIAIVDRISDTTLFQSNYCSVISQNWGIERGHVIGTISFRALRFNNEIK
jgi:hypothetical protein